MDLASWIKGGFVANEMIDELIAEDVCKNIAFLETIYAIDRSIHPNICILDFQNQVFDYVSNNSAFLCGLPVQEVQGMGYSFYLKHVLDEDYELLRKVDTIRAEFYDSIPIHEKKLYTISCDFHLNSIDGRKLLINQKLTPIFLGHTGQLWKVLCVVSLSSQKHAGNIQVSKRGSRDIMKYCLYQSRWVTFNQISLSQREEDIIQFSIRGFTIEEIAKKLFVSSETIKFHRGKLFKKLNVKSISEAIYYLTTNGII